MFKEDCQERNEFENLSHQAFAIQEQKLAELLRRVEVLESTLEQVRLAHNETVTILGLAPTTTPKTVN